MIRIHLYNGGDLAYEPQQWGSEIVFERTISEIGSQTFTIKGSSGRNAQRPGRDKYFSNFMSKGAGKVFEIQVILGRVFWQPLFQLHFGSKDSSNLS